MRRFAGVLVAIACALFPRAEAHADDAPDKQVCRRAYEQGQRLRRTKKLLDARKDFMICARDPCPAVFQPECLQWLTEVDREIPTVVVVGSGGRPGARAAVKVDGAPWFEGLDGIARAIDPGEHQLSVTVDGREVVQRVVVVEGAKAARVVVDLPAPPAEPAPEPARPRSVSWPTIALAGVGVAALGSFAYFGLRGLSQRSDVEACTPDCTASQVTKGKTSFLVADVSLGVSVVTLGLAAYLFLSERGDARATTASAWPLTF